MGRYTPGGWHVAGLVRVAFAGGYRLACVGSTAAARFLAAAWTRAKGRANQGYLRCRLVRGLRSFPSWDRAERRVSRGTLGCRLGPVLSPSRRVVGGGGHASGGRHRSSSSPGVPCVRSGFEVRPAGLAWPPAPRLGSAYSSIVRHLYVPPFSCPMRPSLACTPRACLTSLVRRHATLSTIINHYQPLSTIISHY